MCGSEMLSLGHNPGGVGWNAGSGSQGSPAWRDNLGLGDAMPLALELQERVTALCAHTESCGARGFRRAVLDFQDGETMWVAAMDVPSGSNRVNRGGSWNNNANNCRVANRNNNNPDQQQQQSGVPLCPQLRPPAPDGAITNRGLNRPPSRSRPSEVCDKMPSRPPGVSSPAAAGSNTPGGQGRISRLITAARNGRHCGWPSR